MRQQEFDVMTLVAARQFEKVEQIAAEIEALSDAERAQKFEAMTARRGERLQNTRYVEMRGSVAVIDVNGRLAKRMGFFAEVCDGGTSTETLLKDFTTALENPNVTGIVFNIDSPGGEAFGINEFAGHIYAARGKKPMKAYISGLGCSGAYWIAAACDEIVTDKSAFLGSIGVVSVWIDDTKAYAMLGFDKKVVVSSNAPKKRLDLNKDEDMAEFKAELDAMEKTFHSFVQKARSKTREQVINDFNQGGILSGDAAVKVGMADRVGNLEQVIRDLAKQSKKQASFGAENEGEFDMSFKDKVKELAAAVGFKVEEAEAPETGNAIAPETSAEAPNADMQAQIEAEKANLAAEKEKLFADKAKTFADAEVAANRLLPAERDDFESSYFQALKDDAASPLAEGTRAAKLEAMQAKRQPHHFTSERIAPDATAKVLAGEVSESEKLDAEIDAQTDSYVATVGGKSGLKVVK